MARKYDPNSRNVQVAVTEHSNRLFESMDKGGSTRHKQTTATPEEAARRAATLKTQGRKGAAAPRVNMAFTTANYEYVRIVSRASGQSMTQFLNHIIDEHREQHAEILEKAKDLIQSL